MILVLWRYGASASLFLLVFEASCPARQSSKSYPFPSQGLFLRLGARKKINLLFVIVVVVVWHPLFGFKLPCVGSVSGNSKVFPPDRKSVV